MSGNKRINYACLALAYCNQRPIDGVKSVGLSFSRNISNLYARGSSSPVATYGNLPDIELKYSSHVTNAGFPGFNNEPGLNDFVSFDMLIGSDTAPVLTSVQKSIRTSYMLLSNVTYNLTVDGTFSIDRTFKGWNKTSDCPNNLGRTGSSSAAILSRAAFSSTNSLLPSILSDTSIQDITVSMSINRSFVNEFATRKPYASYITFPIETTCTFNTIITNNLDQFNFNALDTACKNSALYTQNITIATCVGPAITINSAALTSFDYSGAEAQKDGSNLQLSLTYTGFQSPNGISPVIYLEDADFSTPCGC